jgi:hypothetical protein
VEPDLHSTLQQLAPRPRRNLDFAAVMRESGRRRRRRFVAYTALVVIVAGSVGVLAPGLVRQLQDRTVGPGQTPSAGPSRITKLVFQHLRRGWNSLPAPPDVRTGAATAWSGDQLFVWGGIAHTPTTGGTQSNGFIFDARTRKWSRVAPSPLSPRMDPGSVWTGQEFLVWGGRGGDIQSPGFFGDGAAYNPVTNSWRRLPPAPISSRAPLSIWTGKEFIMWGTTARGMALRDGAAYNPSTNTWRKLSEAPIALNEASAAWTGQEMIVVGADLSMDNVARTRTAIGAAYSPGTDTWRRLPNANLSPQASTAAWDGKELIAWDYETHSAAYDPQTDRWRKLVRVPLHAVECYPQSASVDHFVVGDFCGSTIVFDPRRDRWLNVTRSHLVGWEFTEVAADPAVLLLGRSGHTDQKAMFAYRP